MINKNNLSKISLNILSVIAVVISFVFLFNLNRGSDTTFWQRLREIFQIAAVSSFVLILLIRAGAKMDIKLAGIPEKNKRTLYTIAAYLFIPVACAALVGIFYLFSLTGFGDTWGSNEAFGIGLFAVIGIIPFAFGTVFIYLGAIVNALSRWAAHLIWTESNAGE